MSAEKQPRIGVYPGTFDPITNGHMDIIIRAASFLCDRLIVSIASNPGKGPLFDLEERIDLCNQVIAELPADLSRRIEVRAFKGLLIHYVEETGARMIVRGLRAISDFEYEFQMAGMNARQTRDIETVFLMAGETQQFISSRFVKEISAYGGDIKSCVSPIVYQALLQKNMLNSEK